MTALREIILDTETTGLDPFNGDRIVEIAAIELIGGSLTGKSFHEFIDPQRDMPDSAFKVHGLSLEFLSGKPVFSEIVDEFVAFVGDDPIVAHNAEFDFKFINCELARCGRPEIGQHRMVDTLVLARKKFPGAPNSLDALCNRFGIDRSRRVKHGAMIDSEILAEVYMELRGGRQTSLSFSVAKEARKIVSSVVAAPRPAPLELKLSGDVLRVHRDHVADMGDGALWTRYRRQEIDGDPA